MENFVKLKLNTYYFGYQKYLVKQNILLIKSYL